MNKLEHYLQQVCRSMGGPKALREHVRQELREHLLDAVAQHKTAGLEEQQAIDRALAEFGTPETVRSELEATHGHRMMLAMVIDKAMEWKEKTMKAKWLWASWTYVMVVGIIALEILFCCFSVMFLLPKIKKLRADGYLMMDEQSRPWLTWMFNFLDGVGDIMTQWLWPLVLTPLVLWGLFEWRVKSENKPFMRLSALNSVALGLLFVVVLMGASMVLPFLISMPAVGKMARTWAVEQFAIVETSISNVREAMKKSDWQEMEAQITRASMTMKGLSSGPALTSLMKWDAPPTQEELQVMFKGTYTHIQEAFDAIMKKDVGRLGVALQDFEKTYEPLRSVVKRSTK